MDSSTSSLRTVPFPIEGVPDYFLLLPCFIETPEFNANSVDPDQMPRSAASYLDLLCLPMSFFMGHEV